MISSKNCNDIKPAWESPRIRSEILLVGSSIISIFTNWKILINIIYLFVTNLNLEYKNINSNYHLDKQVTLCPFKFELESCQPFTTATSPERIW